MPRRGGPCVAAAEYGTTEAIDGPTMERHGTRTGMTTSACVVYRAQAPCQPEGGCACSV
jgi:hypothetical protein